MVDIDMINEEIEKLENCDCMTWTSCQRLASLYIIKDHAEAQVMKSSPSSIHTITPEVVSSPMTGKI